MPRLTILALPTTAMLLAPPLFAQEADAPAAEEIDEIVVTAPRLRGEVDTDVPPLTELNEEDIEAYGVGSIADLVDALEPSSGSARGRGSGGRPVFLVNGIRVASFREFRSYPPEAIQRVQVLPEEVAQQFGFPPDRRVINFILKDNYSSREVELEYETPDRGGYAASEQEFTLLQIADGARINLNLEHNDTSLLTEAERDIVQTPGSQPDITGDPDPALARSLVADSRNFEATANWAKAIMEQGASVSVNATYEHADTLSLSGLDSVLLVAPDGQQALRTFNAADPLARVSNTDTVSTAASYAKPVGDFQLTATLDGSASHTRTRIDRRADTALLREAALAGTLGLADPLPAVPDGGFDEVNVRTYGGEGQATLRGSPLLLPAGELGLTIDAGYDWRRIASSDTRSGLGGGGRTELTRGVLSGGVNANIPLTSRRDDVLAAVGDIALNLQAGVDHLSDFGTLRDLSAGLTWKPLDRLSLSATYANSEAAPSLSQLGDPRTTTLNVPVFDFARSETALVTVIDGGNAALPAERQSDWKISANWELPVKARWRLNVDYVNNRSRDVAVNWPGLTPGIEAAFPERVIRDSGGALVALDTRPVTYAETRAERLVFGLSMRGQIGPEPERPARGEGRGAGRGGDGPPSPASFGRGRGRDDPRPRYFVNLSHTLELDNTILVAPGGLLLDQLGGDATATLGLPRNTSRLEAGLFFDGYGLRLSGEYTGSAFVEGSGLTGSSDLFVDDLAIVDLRLFADLGEVLDRDDGLFEDLRLSLSVDNLFDGRRIVRDGNGDIPLRFQPLLLDPVGRFVGVELRKLF